ncbi:trypsin-1 [Phlebotomus argentipes]|uniref:trypsin-1 n=1 Tax=Phlebotomus argentipes TaxID=94469 RepID=UPI0028935445|nr:trypsin-1 [Phlebotomus argentipes]
MPHVRLLFALTVIFLPLARARDTHSRCLGDTRGGRIVGGSDAERSEVPFIVSLTRRGAHFCGATILSEKWLVTAGHCLCNSLNEFMKPSQIRAVLGLYRISEYKSAAKEQKEVPLLSIIMHPEYNCLRAANDIALLKIAPLDFTHRIKPACIATEGSFADSTATVSGWGWTHENQSVGQRADTLQKATVEVWANAECEASFRAHEKSIEISDKQLCAGRRNGGVDACWADSGGPLISADGLLIGIISTGIGCARPQLPGIYTRVTEYADWMQQVIENSVK